MRRWLVWGVVVAAVLLLLPGILGDRRTQHPLPGNDSAVFLFDAPPGNSILSFVALYKGNVSFPDNVGYKGLSTSLDVVKAFNEARKPVMAEIEFSHLDRIDRPYRLLPVRHTNRVRGPFLITNEGSNISSPAELGGKKISLAEDRVYGGFIRFLLEEVYNVSFSHEQISNANSVLGRRLLYIGAVDAAQTYLFFGVPDRTPEELLIARDVFRKQYGTYPPERVFVMSADMSASQCRDIVSSFNRSVVFGWENAGDLFGEITRKQSTWIGSEKSVDRALRRGPMGGLARMTDKDINLLQEIGESMVSWGYWERMVPLRQKLVGGETGGCMSR